MCRLVRILKHALLAAVALVALGALPMAAEAAGIGFRNELKEPIVVLGTTFIKGKPYPSKPLLIQPGKVLWHVDLMKGDREIVIFIYDMQTKKLVPADRQIMPYMGGDLFFSVQPMLPYNPNAPKTRLLPAPIPLGEMPKMMGPPSQ